MKFIIIIKVSIFIFLIILLIFLTSGVSLKTSNQINNNLDSLNKFKSSIIYLYCFSDFSGLIKNKGQNEKYYTDSKGISLFIEFNSHLYLITTKKTLYDSLGYINFSRIVNHPDKNFEKNFIYSNIIQIPTIKTSKFNVNMLQNLNSGRDYPFAFSDNEKGVAIISLNEDSQTKIFSYKLLQLGYKPIEFLNKFTELSVNRNNIVVPIFTLFDPKEQNILILRGNQYTYGPVFIESNFIKGGVISFENQNKYFIISIPENLTLLQGSPVFANNKIVGLVNSLIDSTKQDYHYSVFKTEIILGLLKEFDKKIK